MTGDRRPYTGSEIRYRMSDPHIPEVRSVDAGSEIRRYRKSLPPNTPGTYSLNVSENVGSADAQPRSMQSCARSGRSLLSEGVSYSADRAFSRRRVPRSPRRIPVAVATGKVEALFVVGMDLGEVVNDSLKDSKFADAEMVDVLHQPADLDLEVAAKLDTSASVVVAHAKLVPLCRARDAACCRLRPSLAGTGLRA